MAAREVAIVRSQEELEDPLDVELVAEGQVIVRGRVVEKGDKFTTNQASADALVEAGDAKKPGSKSRSKK